MLWDNLNGVIRMMNPNNRQEMRGGPSTHRISGALLMALATLVLTCFVVFGEVPDRWVWLGGTLIFLSSTYLALKESGSSEVSVP